MNTKPEDWTGERLETFILSENTTEHLHRYAMAMELAAGKNVLDIACGEGYGSNLLAGVAARVTGVDIDVETVEKASEKYKRGNLHFLSGSADAMPCSDQSVDLLVSFETIEHHDKHAAMMAEIKRVLKPDGVLIISSPDKKYYSDVPGYNNPYHVKELYRHEFEAMIKHHFTCTQFYAQKSFTGSVMLATGNAEGADDMKLYAGSYDGIQHSAVQGLYLVAIASDTTLPRLAPSLFNGEAVLQKQMQEEKEYAVYHTGLDAANHAALVAEVHAAALIAAVNEVFESPTYKIGQKIMKPISFIKRLFRA